MKKIYFLLLSSFCIVSCTSSYNPKHQSINSQTVPSTPELTEVIVENKNPKVTNPTNKSTTVDVNIELPNPLDIPPFNCIYELVTDKKCTFKNGASIGKPD